MQGSASVPPAFSNLQSMFQSLCPCSDTSRAKFQWPLRACVGTRPSADVNPSAGSFAPPLENTLVLGTDSP
eukprot:344061-Pelagomonas_calceolata.AAC.2